MKLTNREYVVLSCVIQFIKDNDRSPTRSEIGGFFGVSAQTIHEHLRNLEHKKFIALIPHKVHNIKILRGEYRRQPKLV